jgi:hypothetical protein
MKRITILLIMACLMAGCSEGPDKESEYTWLESECPEQELLQEQITQLQEHNAVLKEVASECYTLGASAGTNVILKAVNAQVDADVLIPPYEELMVDIDAKRHSLCQ